MNLNMTEFNKYSLKKHFIMNILNNITQIKKKSPLLKNKFLQYQKKKMMIYFFIPIQISMILYFGVIYYLLKVSKIMNILEIAYFKPKKLIKSSYFPI